MDPYVYPGTNVLRNLRDIRDCNALAEFEAEATARRLKELQSKPLSGSFDANHLRAIHGYIFQDVYSWAGQYRTVNMSRGGQLPFAFAAHIDASISILLGDLRQERRLQGLDHEAFAKRTGHYLGELNAIHPFREGNGRTQREFIRELALENGSVLRWGRISAERMNEASRMSFQQGDNAGLAEAVRMALSGHNA